MSNQAKIWYIAAKGKRVGPVSEQNLKSFYEQRKINDDTKVTKIGMNAWVSLSESGVLDTGLDIDDLPPLPTDGRPIKKSRAGVIAAVLCGAAVLIAAGVAIAFWLLSSESGLVGAWVTENEEYGETAIWTFRDDDTFSISVSQIGGLDQKEMLSGLYSTEDDKLLIAFACDHPSVYPGSDGCELDTEEIDFVLSGNTLTLTVGDDSLVLTRQSEGVPAMSATSGLVGVWESSIGVITIRSNGTYTAAMSSEYPDEGVSGTYTIVGDKLIFNEFDAHGNPEDSQEIAYEFSEDTLILTFLTGETIVLTRRSGSSFFGSGDSPDSPTPSSPSPSVNPFDLPDDPPVTQDGEQTSLTINDARSALQQWLDARPDMGRYHDLRLYSHDIMVHNGEEYHRFSYEQLYYLDFLVNVRTGELMSRQTEDGALPAPPLFEPLENYYNRIYRTDYYYAGKTYTAMDDIIMRTGDWIRIFVDWDYDNPNVEWYDARITVFERDGRTGEWFMWGRDGDDRQVFPDFSYDGGSFTMGFPTTARRYNFHGSYEYTGGYTPSLGRGRFGTEDFRWSYVY